MDFIGYLYEAVNSSEVTLAGSIYRLAISMLLGAVIGYERRCKGQAAGVRTFSLIAMGATLAMLTSIYVPQEYFNLKNGDPGRIAAQVITGVGFIGAGTIIQMKGSVRGLTTAAGIWMVSIIGIAVGLGLYWLSIIACALILFVLVQLERIEKIVSHSYESRTLLININATLTDVDPYKRVLADKKITVNSYSLDQNYESRHTTLRLYVLMRDTVDCVSLFEELRLLNPTASISLSNS